MQFAEVNIDALKRATDLAVGPEGTDVLAKLYHTIANAMQAAYNEGHLAGSMEVNEASLLLERMAYDEGYDEGYADGSDDAFAFEDEGFEDDETFDPAFADEQQVIDYLNEVSDEYERAK